MRTLLAAPLLLLFTLTAPAVVATAPAVGEALPALVISDRGELILDGDDFAFRRWDSTEKTDTVHVIQYFGATLGDRDIFEPLTDRIEAQLPPGSVHVTTILNMDAAMWGTSGMVLRELKKNKRHYPTTTMVVDEEGQAIEFWQLGEKGRALLVLDAAGTVLSFVRGALDDAQITTVMDLLRAHIHVQEAPPES